MERLMDRVARELKLDRAEVRRRNLIPAEKMPYTKPLKARSGAAMQYDSGDYPACQAEVLAAAGWDDFPKRQAEARAQGRYIGIGLAHGIKGTGRGPFESGLVRVSNTGRVTVFTGAAAMGQGLGTALAQICAERARRCEPRTSPWCRATPRASRSGSARFASRQTVTAGSSVLLAARAVADKAKKLASHVLEAAEHDLELVDGEVRVVGAPRARRSSSPSSSRILQGAPGYGFPPGVEPGLEANVNWRTDALAYANACHVAEVEVDIETGGVRILRYVAMQDSGVLINPMMVEGQMQGGVAHGIGNALLRMDGLRRRRPAGDHDVRGLSAADRDRGADDDDAVQGDAVAAQSARRQGRRRGRAPSRPPPRIISAIEDALHAVRRAHRADADHAARSSSS